MSRLSIASSKFFALLSRLQEPITNEHCERIAQTLALESSQMSEIKEELIAAKLLFLDKGQYHLAKEEKINFVKAASRSFKVAHKRLWKWIMDQRYTYLNVALAFFIFLPITPFIVDRLNTWIVRPILSHYTPTILFGIFILLLFIILSWINRNKRLSGKDYFTISLYIYFRYVSDSWTFAPIIDLWKLKSIAYFDLVGLFYAWILFQTWISYVKKFQEVKSIYSIGYLSTDSPIISEVDDKLGRKRFAQEIYTVIDRIQPKVNAFAIGICGPWGSGKTSLAALVREQLESNENQQRFNVIEFRPWLFKDVESLLENFFRQLEKNFSHDDIRLRREFSEYAAELRKMEETLLKSKITSLLDSDKKGLPERFEYLKKRFSKEHKKIIIFIDDLDRLSKAEVVETLRLIRVIADFPNTVYIVGYDKQYVTSAIEKELSEPNAAKYLDKIFNFEFTIPEISPELISERLEELLVTNLLSDLNLRESLSISELQSAAKFSALTSYLQTERDIKRFTNILLIRILLVRRDVNFYHFFLLELLHFRKPVTYRFLYEHRKEIIGRKAQIGDLFNSYNNLKEDSILLSQLLIEANKARAAFTSASYFYNYFLLSLSIGTFSDHAFEEAWNTSTEQLSNNLLQLNATNSALLSEKIQHKLRLNPPAEGYGIIQVGRALISLYVATPFTFEDSSSEDLTAWQAADLFFSLFKGKEPYKIKGLIEDILNKHEERLSDKIIHLFTASRLAKLYQQGLSWKEAPEFFYNLQITLLNETESLKETQHISIFDRIREISLFVKRKQPTLNGPLSSNHFKENVIKTSKRILKDLKTVYYYIIEKAEEQNIAETTILEQIFIDKAGFDLIEATEDEYYATIVNLFLGFKVVDIFKTIAITQPSSTLIKESDGTYFVSKIYELKYQFLYKIDITPIQSPSWVIGLRFSRDSNFASQPSTKNTFNGKMITFGASQVSDSERPQRLPHFRVQEWENGAINYTSAVKHNYQSEKFTLLIPGSLITDWAYAFGDDAHDYYKPEKTEFKSEKFLQIVAFGEGAKFDLEITIAQIESVLVDTPDPVVILQNSSLRLDAAIPDFTASKLSK